jgi:hypothetical protein
MYNESYPSSIIWSWFIALLDCIAPLGTPLPTAGLEGIRGTIGDSCLRGGLCTRVAWGSDSSSSRGRFSPTFGSNGSRSVCTASSSASAGFLADQQNRRFERTKKRVSLPELGRLGCRIRRLRRRGRNRHQPSFEGLKRSQNSGE